MCWLLAAYYSSEAVPIVLAGSSAIATQGRGGWIGGRRTNTVDIACSPRFKTVHANYHKIPSSCSAQSLCSAAGLLESLRLLSTMAADLTAVQDSGLFDDLRDLDKPVAWMIVGTKDNSKKGVFVVHGSGAGGLDELKDSLKDDTVRYSFFPAPPRSYSTTSHFADSIWCHSCHCN